MPSSHHGGLTAPLSLTRPALEVLPVLPTPGMLRGPRATATGPTVPGLGPANSLLPKVLRARLSFACPTRQENAAGQSWPSPRGITFASLMSSTVTPQFPKHCVVPGEAHTLVTLTERDKNFRTLYR